MTPLQRWRVAAIRATPAPQSTTPARNAASGPLWPAVAAPAAAEPPTTTKGTPMTQYMDIARSLLGTKEVSGPAGNPRILEMYRSVGHEWVKDDAVAWCAAFVGHCLEKSGIRSTRLLTARSYLSFGQEIEPSKAREGDIVIFTRGSSAWQGHVAFFVSATATQIKVLGGNQSNAVTMASYARSRLIGVRRPFEKVEMPATSIRAVQQRLRDLGYHEVGMSDGRPGPRTRAAILAFRADNSLPLSPEIDPQLEAALKTAAPRAIAPGRANGKPDASRIVRASNVQIATGAAGAAAAVAANVAPAVEQAERASGILKRLFDLLYLDTLLGPGLPWVMGALCAIVILYAVITRMARVEDHQTGRTP